MANPENRWSFTGPSVLSGSQEAYVREVVPRLLSIPDEINSGCAHGVDSVAFDTAERAFPTAIARLIVPAALHNAELVKRQIMHADAVPMRYPILYAKRGHNAADSYMIRK